MPAAVLRLEKKKRLSDRRDFARIKSTGRRIVRGCLIANWTPASGLYPRLAVITSRKLGKAVTRNRARRLLRESFRLHQHDLSRNVDLILVARASIVGKQFADVEKDFLQALRQADLLKKDE